MTRAAPLRRQNERSHGIGRPSNGVRGTKFVGPTSSVPLITEDAVAEGISAALLDFTPKQIARATNSSVEAAKAWRAGERTPHTLNTINMARSYPSVNMWLAEECGWTREGQAVSAEAVIRWAIAYRNDPGQDGAIARAVLREAGAVKS